jgi:hypothetical protein
MAWVANPAVKIASVLVFAALAAPLQSASTIVATFFIVLLATVVHVYVFLAGGQHRSGGAGRVVALAAQGMSERRNLTSRRYSMGHRRSTTSAKVDRRDFMLGATTALGAAGLAASLQRPDLAEGAAPQAAPVGKSKKPKTEQLSIHQDVPVILPLDVGPGGSSVGDSFYFHADLRSESGGPVVGEVFGTKVAVKTAIVENPLIEQRITNLVFTFNERRDQILVAGVADYPVAGAEFGADQPVVRAIVGGTGAFIGASGELTSTRHPAGGYSQAFSLLK